MKLLLKSPGLANNSIVTELEKLISKSTKGVMLAFIPTAANIEENEKNWLIKDYNNCLKAGLEVDIVDISAMSQKI